LANKVGIQAVWLCKPGHTNPIRRHQGAFTGRLAALVQEQSSFLDLPKAETRPCQWVS